jgi:saccharopine dehydrogenase (NAD+, L-lysine-forming)
MTKVLIVGAGSAGNVVIRKALSLSDIFTDIHVVVKSNESFVRIQDTLGDRITLHQCNADNTVVFTELTKKINPYLVINMALPYQDLSIMEACLAAGAHYVDTANYEPIDEAKFCYKWQWDYHDRFKKAGLCALLGSGFDPGVTNVFCAYAQKHLFDSIDQVDIIDCNDGSHGRPFATNFNPEINIREITQRGKYFDSGKWVETDPLSHKDSIYFPQVGHRDAYLMYHEELESLAKHIPNVKKIRFWMTFSSSYLNYLDVLQNVGMTSIEPILYEGKQIVPLQFLKAVLPDPQSLGENYSGKTCIGTVISGTKNGEKIKKIIYNICEHQKAYDDCKAQAVGYTTGVPAMIGAKMLIEKKWLTPGVYNMEQFNPDPFMDDLNKFGLPWSVENYEYKID